MQNVRCGMSSMSAPNQDGEARLPLTSIFLITLKLLPDLHAAIKLRFWPLTTFVIVEWLLFLSLILFPRSWLSKGLGSWIGAFPRANELASRYFFRAARYSLLTCLVIVVTTVLGAYATFNTHNPGHENIFPIVFFSFVCPILAGVSLLASLQHLITGLRIRLAKRDYVLLPSIDERP